MNSSALYDRFFIRRLDETEYVNVFDCGDEDSSFTRLLYMDLNDIAC